MSNGINGTQQSENRERQEEPNAWDAEVRRIIRQKLTLVVEDLVQQQKERERRKREAEDAEMEQSDDGSGKKAA
ncbi:hypothetical protein DL89DRAFT_294999 [Linderina pennispora]|uniref:Uncharacterized protein n=1 Tax=Linderina pennispora TaxID=61395 RepID=A0A1Y1W1T2_9FUNG|nr:uncharacterized protein DL89DRAFT_294999 [Linderina pennispora]ORX67235.1 hypothetical protein DL89DRAFT_294999 [Linderina pennispora]